MLKQKINTSLGDQLWKYSKSLTVDAYCLNGLDNRADGGVAFKLVFKWLDRLLAEGALNAALNWREHVGWHENLIFIYLKNKAA